MGLFDKLFSGNKIEIASPVKGESVPISQVPDDTFAQEMVGKGVAIIPSDGKFYSPINGELVVLFPTGHAFCLKSEDGAEILVHIGIDTVKLKGQHYKIHATQGATVKKGDLIVEADIEAIKSLGYDVITPVMISNHDKFQSLEKKTGAVAAGDAVIVLSK